MLTLLTLDQVSTHWDIIKYGLEQSLPPIVADHPDKMNRVLTSLLSSKAQCWASYVKKDKMRRFEGIVVTRILLDDVSNTKNLLIYAIYGYDLVDNESWLNGLKALAEYADNNSCAQIVAYTNLEHVIELAKHLGADTSFTFLSWNVNEIVQKLDNLNGEN